MSSAYPANSISFCRTDNKAVFLQINTDGTVIWKGRVVESDADFRAAMMEVHQHLCGSMNGEPATVRTALANVERLTAERDEARRDACFARCNPWIPEHHITVAADRGWDCFDSKEAKP
jgi:hypothetical protein